MLKNCCSCGKEQSEDRFSTINCTGNIIVCKCFNCNNSSFGAVDIDRGRGSPSPESSNSNPGLSPSSESFHSTVSNNFSPDFSPEVISPSGSPLDQLQQRIVIVLNKFFTIAPCDAAGSVDRPPTPPTVELPGAAVQAPEVLAEPAQPEIPELEHPLLSDEVRSDVLYSRYGILNFGGDDGFRRLSSIISNQVIVERSVEAALVDDGFHPLSIHHRYAELRQLLHSPRGELLSERTYREYVSQIREQGTRESVPYRRVIQAVRSSHLLLERADGRFP